MCIIDLLCCCSCLDAFYTKVDNPPPGHNLLNHLLICYVFVMWHSFRSNNLQSASKCSLQKLIFLNGTATWNVIRMWYNDIVNYFYVFVLLSSLLLPLLLAHCLKYWKHVGFTYILTAAQQIANRMLNRITRRYSMTLRLKANLPTNLFSSIQFP